MNIDALKEALEANPNAKLLYTIPSFQNPTGITTSLEKRKFFKSNGTSVPFRFPCV